MTQTQWPRGDAPVAVILLTLNEAHNIDGVLANLRRWAREVFVVDSFSADDTVALALAHGAWVVQRRFRGFGEQWNFALGELPVTAPWTMKLDPDERLTDRLKASIAEQTRRGAAAQRVCRSTDGCTSWDGPCRSGSGSSGSG